ncbi:unnamed protein product [Camellia sinensis]
MKVTKMSKYLTGCDIDASLDDVEFFGHWKKIFARLQDNDSAGEAAEGDLGEKFFGSAGEVAVGVFICHLQILSGSTKSCDVVNCDLEVDAVAELGRFLEDLGASRNVREIDSCQIRFFRF